MKGYYAHKKFNVMEIANRKNVEANLGGEGRITTHERASDEIGVVGH